MNTTAKLPNTGLIEGLQMELRKSVMSRGARDIEPWFEGVCCGGCQAVCGTAGQADLLRRPAVEVSPRWFYLPCPPRLWRAKFYSLRRPAGGESMKRDIPPIDISRRARRATLSMTLSASLLVATRGHH